MKPETQKALEVLRSRLYSDEFLVVREHVRYAPSNSAKEPDFDELLERVDKFAPGFIELLDRVDRTADLQNTQ